MDFFKDFINQMQGLDNFTTVDDQSHESKANALLLKAKAEENYKEITKKIADDPVLLIAVAKAIQNFIAAWDKNPEFYSSPIGKTATVTAFAKAIICLIEAYEKEEA